MIDPYISNNGFNRFIPPDKSLLAGRCVEPLSSEEVDYIYEPKQVDESVSIEHVYYPGYIKELYCSYPEIVEAIGHWGKVEAILMGFGGLRHTFIVSFNKPIHFSNDCEDGIKVDLSGGHDIQSTPFLLRGMYNMAYNNVLLSTNKIVFDICFLQKGQFDALDLWEARHFVIDERLGMIGYVAGKNASDEDLKEQINISFSEEDKAKILLEWIKQAGISMLKIGLYKSGNNPMVEYSNEDILNNYRVANPSFWKVVNLWK